MVSLRDVKEARERIEGVIKRTPLLRSEYLSSLCGGDVYLKLENLQLTGSFKIRGAFNKILLLAPEDRRRGVVTASTGNHGLAVAMCANKLGVPAKIVVPVNASKVKIREIEKYGVELILYGDVYDDAERKAIELARSEGLTYISPYNDKFIVAGQGTIGLEIMEDLPDVDAVIVPVGSGGLISGVSVAVKEIKPSVQVVGVQSEASPVMYESLRAGRIVDVEVKDSIADGLSGGIERNSVTFELVKRYVDRVLLCTEESIKKAIFLLWIKDGQVTEGSGAVSITPIIENRLTLEGKKVVAVISGGNIRKELFRNIINLEAKRYREGIYDS